MMPPSPTTSSKAAQRRVQASPRISFGSAGRKRLSDSSNDAVSPKISKTSKGKQPSDQYSAHSRPQRVQSNNLFKKPSIDALRSFQSASAKTSFISSMNTSFNTDSTPMSSQQSAKQPLTANTSFASDMGDTDAFRPKMTRTSSTTMGSELEDEFFVQVSAQLEQEWSAQIEREHLGSSGSVAQENLQSSRNMTRESSSTFGSIDEDALLETSFKIEAGVYSITAETSPTRRFLRSDSARLGGSSPSFQPLNSRNVASPTTPISKPHISNSSTTPTRCIIQSRTPRTGGSSFKPSPPHSVLGSPSKMSHHIFRIPEQNLFVEDISAGMTCLPYFILFICRRIATDRKVSMLDLTKNLGEQWSNPDSFWRTISKQCPTAETGIREERSLWSAQKRAFDGYTFKGQITLEKRKSEPVFKLKLLPVAPDLSCRFQRHFDADRFLFLNFPSFAASKQPKPPRFTQDDMKRIEERWYEWFCREHSFLGRKWRAFHIEPTNRKGGLKDDMSDKRVILFATEGCGIEKPMSVGEMMNWFFPFALNREQNFCKAFARLSLGLSRTTPTLAFKPSQIRYVPDIKADGSAEDTRYNDRSLSWNNNYEQEAVMNDGCSLMSVGAAHEIWKLYKKQVDTNDPMPSAFQGRIGGAKGMWMVSAESYTRNPDDRSIWLEITDSQKKFEPHPEDMSDHLPYDPDRLTFELCAYSSQPDTSDLHVSFIPIMNDRGVPKEVLASFVTERLNLERSQLLEILPDPLKMYDWVFKQSSTAQNSEEIRWQAALPHTLPNKIKLLIESGFDPTEAPYLAKTLHHFIKQEQLWMEQKLRIPLGKSAFLYGVADPLGVLAPGEVHIQFSRPFIDDMTEEHFRYLNDIDLLVARQPACRRSDIQKVRATTRPELAHLVDVVVFSSRGQYPLAGKLQGGDYDGDMFWLCWETALVDPFKNAPPPIEALDPSKYGIKKDERRLDDVMNPDNLSTVDNLLKEILAFRTSPPLLGQVTNFLEKQAYKENRMQSDRLDALYDMHDLLVDAPKQAYIFTERNWRDFIRYSLRCGNPKPPAYKAAMEACEKVKEMGEVDHLRTKEWEINEDNIIDHLYFNIVRKHDVETLKMVTDAFPKDTDDDPKLRYPYLTAQELNNPAMELELGNLRSKFSEVYWHWNRGMMNNPDNSTAENYNRVVDECYKQFRALMPTQLEDPEIKSWMRPYLSKDFSMWDTLRASALYMEYPKRVPFVWHMAGRELAELKCKSRSGSRSVCWPIHKVLRPKLLRIPRRFDETSSDDEFVAAIDEAATCP